jgi:DNA-binding beta-propeller fold protein YncE
MRTSVALAGLLALIGLTAAWSAGASLPLRAVANIPLPGGESRLDYASIDSKRGTLFIAHLGGGKVIAFDLRRRRVVRTISAPGAHGVLAVPELGRVFATATDARQLLTIDARTGSIVARAPAGVYPDGIAYDPVERRVFVSDEVGGAVTVFTANGKRIGRVGLGFGSSVGNVQYDSGARHILVDVQSQNVVAAIDPRSLRILRRVSLPGCENDHGLSVDAPRRLAFIACDHNATLLTLDLTRMKVTGRAGVGDGPDVLAFDSSLRRLYVASESGVIAIFAERGRSLRKVAQAFLASNAHVVAVDSQTHLVYFPLEHGPVLRIMAPTGVHG